MSKRQERSSSSNSQPAPKRNREEMLDEHETDWAESAMSFKMILDKLNIIERRMDDNFSNLHTQISTMTCELKEKIVKHTIKDV